ncbi:hypothetical protein IJ541_10975 [bacterium]|nr:hypothetical protein [bacterium]
MKKRYAFGVVVLLLLVIFIAGILYEGEDKKASFENNVLPRFGQKLWTYNMNKHEFRKHSDNDDDMSKEEIVLQILMPEETSGNTTYSLLTDNAQIPKENAIFGEYSQEFLVGKKLYSYFPKTFEFYEIIFNGVKFVPKKLSNNEIQEIFPDYKIIKVSELVKGNYSIDFAKSNNKYILFNDKNKDFYKYYIVPNDSKSLEIGEFSNQFKVFDKVDIKIQRLEGCSKAYPCYEIIVK